MLKGKFQWKKNVIGRVLPWKKRRILGVNVGGKEGEAGKAREGERLSFSVFELKFTPL